MSDVSISDSPVKISMKLADGELYTLFHHSESGEKTFNLVPAHDGQDTAEINIFHSRELGSEPTLIGSILCVNIPEDPQKRLLNLVVSLSSPGLFSASVSHSGEEKPQCMKINLDHYTDSSKGADKNTSLKNVFRWLGGVFFVFAGLFLFYFLISLVTQWGSLSATTHPST